MRVLLIFPPQFYAITPRFKTCLQSGLGFLPPFGLLSLATYLREKTGVKVKIIDSLGEKLDYSGLLKQVKEFSPDLAGISAMSHTLVDVLKTAQLLKEWRADLPVVLGGPHTQLFPAESLLLPGIDYLVLGEGEIPFTRLVQALMTKEVPENIAGVIDKAKGEGKGKAKPYFLPDLAELCPVDRSFLDCKKYYTVVSRHPPTTVMVSSRGCPYSCIFCHTAGGKVTRAIPIPKVLEEIRKAKLLGIKEFIFFDENFLHSRERAVSLAEELIKQDLKIYFDFRSRADSVDLELLKLLKKAGAQRIQFGLESGNPEVLKTLQKGFTLEQAELAVRWAKQAGLFTYAGFMLGLPGEKESQLRDTLNFALNLPLDYVDFSIAMPYPGTRMYEMAREKGLIPGDPWREFARNPSPDFQVPYWQEHFSRRELERILSRFFKQFYLRPGYLAKSLFNLSSAGELKRKLQAAAKVILRL